MLKNTRKAATLLQRNQGLISCISARLHSTQITSEDTQEAGLFNLSKRNLGHVAKAGDVNSAEFKTSDLKNAEHIGKPQDLE